MQTALHTLIQSAPACPAIKADLRQSTITLAWPANALIQRTDYVLVPKAEIDAAIADDNHLVTLTQSPYPGLQISEIRFHSDDLDFSFELNSVTVLTMYFERFGKNSLSRPSGSWWGEMHMFDAHGFCWSRRLVNLVTNDFGDLVFSTTGERP